jgi:16S rRNA processing protein RimM
MARISGPYGVKGWIKIQPFTVDINQLLNKKEWLIGDEKFMTGAMLTARQGTTFAGLTSKA